MLNDNSIVIPKFYDQINQASQEIKFTMPSDLKTGALLRTLAASKPGGRMLDLGTGTGLSLAWIAEGSDVESSIVSLDNSETFQKIAKDAFLGDNRITFICEDGNEWLSSFHGAKFDLIFADAWPGKFEKLEEALALVNVGGFYLIDDLLPQPNWGEGHQSNVDKLIGILQDRPDFNHTILNWSTGLILFTKTK